MARFPGKVMLDVNDIATLTDYSKGHIYNLASANRLPFKVGNELGDRILVSIIELSDYLDLTLLSKPSTQAQEPLPPKRRVGRPRGTTKARMQVQLFQSELRVAILTGEGQDILGQASQYVEEMCVSSDVTSACREEFELAKLVFKTQLKTLRTRFQGLSLSIRESEHEGATAVQGRLDKEPPTV